MFGPVWPHKYRYFDSAVFRSTFERFFFGTNLIFGRETESDYDREGNNNNIVTYREIATIYLPGIVGICRDVSRDRLSTYPPSIVP